VIIHPGVVTCEVLRSRLEWLVTVLELEKQDDLIPQGVSRQPIRGQCLEILLDRRLSILVVCCIEYLVDKTVNSGVYIIGVAQVAKRG
jgi:hypothetical protein